MLTEPRFVEFVSKSVLISRAISPVTVKVKTNVSETYVAISRVEVLNGRTLL
jgi:hypothetical protein